MKKVIIFLVFLVILGGVAYYYISSAKKSATPASQTQTQQKVGVTSKTGIISKTGASFFIQEKGGEPLEIDSYSMDFAQYLGQSVTVSGQYSGDTLFVSNIEM